MRDRAAQHPERDAKGIARQNHVVHVAGGQLLDDLLRLERIDLGLLLGTDLRQQRGVDILPVRDRRFRDPATELFDDDLAAALAFSPLVVGGEADPDGLGSVRAAELNRDRPGRIEQTLVSMVNFLTGRSRPRASCHRREDAVGGVVHRQALDRDCEDLIRLRDLDHGVRDLLPRQLERVVHVVRERHDRRPGGLRLELRVLVRSVHETRDELQVADAVAELEPAADRTRGPVARRLEAGAREEARVHPDVVLPARFERDDVLVGHVVHAVDRKRQ